MGMIECVGNTEEEVIKEVRKKIRQCVDEFGGTDRISLGEWELYGNSEYGYKIVQPYDVIAGQGIKFDVDEYNKRVLIAYEKNIEWRYGQTLYNVLYEIYPEYANKIRGVEGVDPYYLGRGELDKFREYLTTLSNE